MIRREERERLKLGDGIEVGRFFPTCAEGVKATVIEHTVYDGRLEFSTSPFAAPSDEIMRFDLHYFGIFIGTATTHVIGGHGTWTFNLTSRDMPGSALSPTPSRSGSPSGSTASGASSSAAAPSSTALSAAALLPRSSL